MTLSTRLNRKAPDRWLQDGVYTCTCMHALALGHAVQPSRTGHECFCRRREEHFMLYLCILCTVYARGRSRGMSGGSILVGANTRTYHEQSFVRCSQFGYWPEWRQWRLRNKSGLCFPNVGAGRLPLIACLPALKLLLPSPTTT